LSSDVRLKAKGTRLRTRRGESVLREHWPRVLRRAMLGGILLAVAGCAAAIPGPAPAPFDSQTLLGRWQGEWRDSQGRGTAVLDIREVNERSLSGWMHLENYWTRLGAQEAEVRGAIVERRGTVRLILSEGIVPMELTVAGTLMTGSVGSGAVPGMTTNLVLRQSTRPNLQGPVPRDGDVPEPTPRGR